MVWEINLNFSTFLKKTLLLIMVYFNITCAMNLNNIRKELLAKRNELTSEYIKEKSLKMTEDIMNLDIYKKEKYLYLYSPVNNEIDTNYLIINALKDNKIVSLPIVLSQGDMVFVQINKSTIFKKNKYKILEPLFDNKNIIDQPGLMIVPLVGYYNDNVRIGYGKQYYNNYLNNREKTIYTIGVGYQFQKIDDLDLVDERDIKLNEIRTY